MISRPLLTRAGIIVAVGLLLDQLSKEWALNSLENGRTIGVLPTLQFDLAFNSGFSFGTGSGSGRLIGLLVIGVSAYLVWLIVHEASPRRALLFSVILSGAIGNLLDRLFRAKDGFLSGQVVDFIDVSWYAVFNVADMFVVCGVLALVVTEYLAQRADSVEAEAAGLREE